MLSPDQTGIPLSFTSGDSVKFYIEHADYPSSEFSLAFVLSRLGKVQTPIAGTQDGAGFLFSFKTSGFLPGQYAWALVATSLADGSRSTVQRSDIWAWPDPMTDTPKSTAQIILENLEGALKTLSGGTNSSVSVNGQSFTKRDIGQLQIAIREQRSIVMAEMRRLGIMKNGAQKTLVTRFRS